MTLLRNVRVVDLDQQRSGAPVDLRIVGERVTAIATDLRREDGEEVFDGAGRWLIPGLWDGHVHLGQWARRNTRLDVAGLSSRAETLARVASAPSGTSLLVGAGYRPAAWEHAPTVGSLDEVTGSRPVVLVSGDAHAGWLNTAALDFFCVSRRDEPVTEAEWFALVPRILAIEDAQVGPSAYDAALRAASARGIVGVIDYEFEPGFANWPDRMARIEAGVRVRTSTYPVDLSAALSAGLRTGSRLGHPLLTMGPLKIISDGSLNTRTAHCCRPYADGSTGVQNVAPEELANLLRLATDHHLGVALHAIGDRAIATALQAFADTGATGSIEHAQLLADDQAAQLAGLGVAASVQPAHLLDDRWVTAAVWGESGAQRSFRFRDLADAGVRLVLGSDAPVAPLDPWLAVAAAVHRGEPCDEPWYPAQSLTTAEALAASTDGRSTVEVGGLADLVFLDADPLLTGDSASVAARLRSMPVAATMVAGTWVHQQW